MRRSFSLLAIALGCHAGSATDVGEAAAAVNETPSVKAPECLMWMAPSTLEGAGRGVVAGKDMAAEDLIDSAVSLTVPASYIGDWQLQNYIYASEEDGQSMALFGVGMLFNHREPPNVHHYWDSWEMAHSSDNKYVPSTTYSPVAHNTTEPLVRGQEIFTSYGDSSWFTDRGIFIDGVINGSDTANFTTTPPESVRLVSDEVLIKYGHCITDVYIAKSDKTLGGYGVFATRNFTKGEIVSISPVLTLPKAELENLHFESVLQNYCIAPQNSTVAIFPIGYSAIANHDHFPNMAMEWYAWPNDPPNKLADTLAMPTEELLNKNFAQLDIAYRALVDIEANTELTVFYGINWLHEWAEFLAQQVAFDHLESSEQKQLETDEARPLFRHFIEPPESFPWPELWRDFSTGEEEEEEEEEEGEGEEGSEEGSEEKNEEL
jgi:hypothetical protein